MNYRSLEGRKMLRTLGKLRKEKKTSREIKKTLHGKIMIPTYFWYFSEKWTLGVERRKLEVFEVMWLRNICSILGCDSDKLNSQTEVW